MGAAVIDKRTYAEQLRRELLARESDALTDALKNLTERQRSFVMSPARKRIAEGGNRSGKTWTNIVDFLLQARGIHPARQWNPRPEWKQTGWLGWYATCSFEMFSLMGWMHFKRLLLLPGESVHKLPTRHIISIGWNNKNPEIPNYLQIKRDINAGGGVANIWIKSYEQGASSFQSGAPDVFALDEESSGDIYEEGTMRLLDRAGAFQVSATPIEGEPWLQRLREDAETGAADIFHVRFPTWENPSIPRAEIEEKQKELRGNEALMKLRLEGFPLALEGLVYHDKIWTADHWVEPFQIPPYWARYRWIDPGYTCTACLWFAVSPQGDVVVYREYKGEKRTIAENAAEIRRLSGGERYVSSWIDRYYCAKHEGVHGEQIIDLWKKSGLRLIPSVDIGVLAAIENVWTWLSERGGANGERPRVRFFKSCVELAKERRRLRWHDAREKGDLKDLNPIKRDDDLMDCLKGALACGLKYAAPPRQAASPGSTRELLEKDRAVWVTPVSGEL